MKTRFCTVLILSILCLLTSCTVKKDSTSTANNYTSNPQKKVKVKKIDQRSTVEKVIDETIDDAQRKKAEKKAGHPAKVNWPPNT
jgi:uncharacterized protein YxeA